MNKVDFVAYMSLIGVLSLGVVACSSPSGLEQEPTAVAVTPAKKPEVAVQKPTTPSPPQLLPPLADRADIILEFTNATTGSSWFLQGWTNLPVATKLAALVTDPKGVPVFKDWLKFKVEQGGYFKTSALEAFSAGKYHVKLISLFASAQPAEVRAILGRNGENLRGPLVAPKSDLQIEFEQDFLVGGNDAARQQHERFAQEATELHEIIDGYGSLYQRLRDCGSSHFVRDFNAAIKPLQAKVEHSIGGSPGSFLRLAGGYLIQMPLMKPGCTGGGDATTYADIDAEYLKDMKAAADLLR